MLRQESYKISFVDCQVAAKSQVGRRPTWQCMAIWQCHFVMIKSHYHMIVDLGLLRNLLNVYLDGSTHLKLELINTGSINH